MEMETPNNLEKEPIDLTGETQAEENKPQITILDGMYQNWFLDYASYVILERAVPYIEDGLKPVQRRLMHAMWEMDDGRFNKVANIIGSTMKYHPHGDASIGDALVQLGQKEILIDTQGNWGNIYTGDSAAAPRYIEARLSKFANDVVFNPKVTKWKNSYDGRNKEPITLPIKFPLLLAQGVEGIAVGLSSKILPHNFNELIDASIDYLNGTEPNILPDFPTGGLADFSRYNGGLRGGKVRIRAKITQVDKKTLAITEIPFGTTTGSLIETIVSANEKGKIKIKKIEDNTAEFVEILIYLHNDVSPDITIDALYAFTDCEISISPNCCIIDNERPRFTDVNEVLKRSTNHTLNLLKLELEIQKAELQEQWHFASLEKIFIENRIYRDIEECETWESVITTIDKGLEPFKKDFIREVTTEDIVRLTEIKIKRISKFDSFKAEEGIIALQDAISETQNHLNHIIDFTINYFTQIKKKYGKGKERKTEIRAFDNIEATVVAVANAKLYFNKEEGFAGTSLNKFEYVCECSDIDDIIIFREDGTFFVTRVSDKFYVGKNVIHIAVFKKNDERTIYNMIYRDGKNGATMVKRFAVTGITRDKEYDLTKGEDKSKVIYFTANPNGEAEIVKVLLKPKPKLRKTVFDFDFSSIAIKGRNAQGNTLTKNPIHKISLKEQGLSTLGARFIWFDEATKRLNTEQYGIYLGEFEGEDKILTIGTPAYYKLYSYDLTNHFAEDINQIKKYNPKEIFTVIYWDESQKQYYIKRFNIEENDKKNIFIPEEDNVVFTCLSSDKYPQLKITYLKGKEKTEESEIINVQDFIGIKGVKAKGKRLSTFTIKELEFIEPIPADDEDNEEEPEQDYTTSNNIIQPDIEGIPIDQKTSKPTNIPQQITIDF